MMLLKKSLVLTINKTAVKLQTFFKKLYLVKLNFYKISIEKSRMDINKTQIKLL